MRAAPFNVNRYLTVPPDFTISVFARLSGARFLATAPNGDLLVSQPGAGKVLLLRQAGTGDPAVFTFVSGLRRPHDIVFHTVGSTSYVFISETHQINRYTYTTGATTAGQRTIVVSNLPSSSSPELGGAYGHELKNIAVGPDNMLYVSIASTSNASPSDAVSDPVRCAVYRYNFDGTGGQLFARGLRNAEGLAFLPGSNNLWVTVNQRDNIRFPRHTDWNGDGSDDYGKLMQSYVDNHPPEAFTSVKSGANYGWPYANPHPDTAAGYDNMPFEFDYDNNRDWTNFPESTFTRIDKGIQAHSAPLGFSFLQASSAPPAYRNGAVIALHGSWNRAAKTGYKIVYFPWSGALPGAQMDLVKGWLDESTQGAWGRPVDVVPDIDGDLYISDDHSGTIYKLSYQPSTSQSLSSFSLINADTDQPIAGFAPLAEGAVINLAALPTRNLTIRAFTNPATVGSVRITLAGPQNYSKVESAAPYAIAGDNAGNMTPMSPALAAGSYTLTGTPYTGPNGSGTAGTAKTVRFSVTSGSASTIAVSSFSLFNADNDQPITGFHPIANNAVIDLSNLPSQNVTIRAFTNPATVGSVRITLAGPRSFNTLENLAPYAIAGDNSGNLNPISPPLPAGSYQLTGTPYPNSGAAGTAGTVKALAFTVVQ